MTLDGGAHEMDLVVVADATLDAGFQGHGFFVGDAVHVGGDLEILDADAVTRRLPNVSLLPSQFQNLDRRPVLLATGVTASRPAD